MGMAASQARFLGLTARQNNVEFEGQQINQQRTMLSNESANYYNDLLGMSVPTPPSVDSYTKTIYTFSDGALTNTVTSMIAQSNGMYTMSYLSKWQDDYAAIAAATSVVSQLGTAGNYIYAIGSRNLRELGSLTGTTTLGNSIVVNGKTYNVKTDAAGPYYEELAYEKQPRQQVPQNEIANFEYYQYDQTTNKIISQVFKDAATGGFYTLDDDENRTDLPGVTEDDLLIALYNEVNTGNAEDDAEYSTTLIEKNADGNYYYEPYEQVTNKNYLTQDQINSITTSSYATDDEYLSTLSPTQLANTLKEEAAWRELLTQKYGQKDWMVRYALDTTTGIHRPYFYAVNDLENAIYDGTTKTSLSKINCYTIGSEQKIEEFKGVQNCKIEKDSSGRLITLSIPTALDDGSLIYVDYPLTTETATDQEKYNDAMNQYEYDKALYDQAVEKINAKIEVIQAEDKNLELRLKQLDTEQKAIQTEKDAVSKVIEKNTSDTFKTFSA
jgi:hypothetical protein